METEKDWKVRTRVSFKVSAKGLVQPDVTLEMFDVRNDAVLLQSTALLDGAMIIAEERSKKEILKND